MARRNKADVELGYVRSAWAELAELEMSTGALLTVRITPGPQRGVLHVILEATLPELAGSTRGFKTRHRAPYPNGQQTMFMPWFWQICMRFNEETQEAYEASLVPLPVPEG